MRTSSPASSGRRRSPRHPKENLDPNPLTPSFRAKTKSPLPPRPPLHPNPLKRKLNLETDGASDSGVKVVLRMRPLGGEEDEDSIVKKVSDDSVAVAEHLFTFDWIAESGSTQREIFDLVGLPLVENCMAGFNSSIFAYGQTGSGKTYTMWGPLVALSKDEMASEERGLTSRVFQRLFTCIEEEQMKHSAKQLSYQCRCSFLEIYNEQITDLLNPSHGNLQIREDVRTGIYVENLMEEYVCSTKDVIQLLRKGLENKRTGATSINAESSRSHCVFTCIVESRSKCISNGLSSVRTSRINLVDLAGSERQKQTGAAGERLKEAGNINRSLSQLGNLINILAEVSQSGKQRHIPYRDSKLTFLLQESLGGNAKLAMICTVSPSESCKSETFSTLRFAKRAKAIKNKAIVNEVTQDDVHVLREQIRQLKDELVRVKSLGNTSGNNGNYSTGWDARRSLAILRQSLSRPLPTQSIEDNDEEMEIDDADVEKPFIEANSFQLAVSAETDADAGKLGIIYTASSSSSADPVKDLSNVEMEICKPENVVTQSESNPDVRKSPCLPNDHEKMVDQEDSKPIASSEVTIEENASVTLHENILNDDKPQNENLSSDIKLPICNLSPDSEHLRRKSLKTSSSITASQKVLKGTGKLDSGSLGTSTIQTLNKNNSQIPTERLAKSLHRGLELFEFHEQQSTMRRSAFAFPQKPINVMPVLPVAKVDCGVQTLPEELQTLKGQSSDECNYCKCKNAPNEYKDASVETELQLTPSDSSHLPEKSRKQVPKAVEKVLAGAIRREMALEDHCVKQASEIAHLNRLVQQYKHERECNIVIEHTREGKIARLEGLMDGIIPAEHYMDEEFKILANEYKLLKEKYENHPEVLRVLIELKRVQDELEGYRNFFELGERDVLMEEIQDLRCQLQYYVHCPTSQKRGSLLKLAYDNNTCSKLMKECPDEKFEEERRCWTKSEGKWISLAEDLQVELETTRSLAEKQKVELDSERKCLAELKEALQSAMQSHARMLEQYADLQEKHVQLLAKHRKIRDGITDVKKAAAKAGIKGAEIKFIDALAAEISTLKAEREKEKRYWKDENKGLQAQLRDTAEALHAAGEVLVRLKEAEEAAKLAQNRISAAEKDAEKSRREMNDLKKKRESEISLLNQRLAESQLPKEARAIKYDNGESLTDKTWRVKFEQFDQVNENDFSRGAEHHSWFSDYDRCNI